MTHVVFFKLKDPNQTHQNQLAAILNKMQGKINLVDSMEVGIDFLRSERSFDVVLIVRLPKENLDPYQNDPLHCACKAEFAPLVASSKTVDFE